MPHSSAFERYRAEAVHALSRVQHYREQGDADRAAQWHGTWSLAETAADAELREKGGGARALRHGNQHPLRPLPEDTPPLTLPPVPASEPLTNGTAAAEAASDPLPAALERHARIDRALRAGGPNPYPNEMEEGEWQFHLTAFRVGGPYDCELLQAAEAAIEVIVEFRPEYWQPKEELDAAQASLEHATLAECDRIYRESLAELTEDDLRSDLENCLHAGRNDTAALIEAELRQRERETAPDPLGAVLERSQSRESVPSTREQGPPPAASRPPAGEVGGVAITEPSKSVRASGKQPRLTKPERPRRGAVAYGATSEPPIPSAPRTQSSVPPADTAAESPPAGYTTAPAWIDTAGRTRTWSLFDPSGEKMAEIATKRDAEKLAALFNRLMTREAPRSP